jgi:hypothetical protein
LKGFFPNWTQSHPIGINRSQFSFQPTDERMDGARAELTAATIPGLPRHRGFFCTLGTEPGTKPFLATRREWQKS